jgi:hypothetical protein
VTETVTEPTPDDSATQLGRIRARRQAIVKDLHLDLKVPRWDDEGDFPPVYARYRPIPISRLQKLAARAEQDKHDDAVMLAEAALLVELCDGVFMVQDGQRVSFDPQGEPDDWPKPGPRLAAVLGLDGDLGSPEVLRKLYFTDGDLVEASRTLQVFSQRAAEEADKQLLGESQATRR